MFTTKTMCRLFVFVFAVLATIPVTRGDDLPPDSWQLPFNINMRHPPAQASPDAKKVTQSDIYEFAWQSFIALNWPHKKGGPGGMPDKKGRLAPIRNDDQPLPEVVWESYLSPSQVFINPNGWNVRWNQATRRDTAEEVDVRVLELAAYSNRFAPGINQPYTHANVPTGPVVDQNKQYLRYEVTLNQSFFSYLKFFRYYDRSVQEQAVGNFLQYVQQHNSVPPPLKPGMKAKYFQALPTGTEFYLRDVFKLPSYAQQGIVEVKAAWKILKTEGENADIPGRYFRRRVRWRLPDGSLSATHLVGLVGLHIHRVTPFGHLPSTFEQVDNVKLLPDDGPLPLPKHPALNPGRHSDQPPPYYNGYEIGGVSGKSGLIPSPLFQNEKLLPVDRRKSINVSRVTPIPQDVQAINRKYRKMLKGSVWYYYQLIGTQNRNLNQQPNPHLGPGILGAQTSNVQNLVNSTLETYTQKGFSCAHCHLNAFPHGVREFPPYEDNYKRLHVMSFLLQNAKK